MAHKKLKIGIIGVGMVGTPLKRYFEELEGHKRGETIFLYDTDPKKGYFDDINKADVIFISVPTPRTPEGSAGLNALKSSFRLIAGSKIVVIKSSVPPGTTESFQKKYPQHKVLFNPEFLTEANAWENTKNPDRQFVGWTKKSRDAAKIVLGFLPKAPMRSPSDKLNMSATEAEIVKYGANMFLTRKVTFANAIFDLASHLRADYENIKIGIASDQRIGPSHLDIHYHGYRGYGGYCFTKDTEALIAHCKGLGLKQAAKLFESDRLFNENVLATQGLTPEDVSVHDHEWVRAKMKKK